MPQSTTGTSTDIRRTIEDSTIFRVTKQKPRNQLLWEYSFKYKAALHLLFYFSLTYITRANDLIAKNK